MKKIITIVLGAAAIAGVSFYGGMAFAKKSGPSFNRNNFQGANASRTITRNGAGFLAGQIISKDDKSITIKLRDGGTKIVFFSDTTEIGKFDKGSASDLNTDQNVSVSGSTNQDGSITAQSIQVRPQMPENH